MKVIITLEDNTKGIFPVVQWVENGVTDNVSQSLSLNLAAQFAEMIKRYAQLGAINVIDSSNDLH